jgi:preprotein translocase subunit SecF
MAWRLKLVPTKTNIDFFRCNGDLRHLGRGGGSPRCLLVATIGLNFGVDFKGGTTIRTESTTPVDVGVYRDALAGWPGRHHDHRGDATRPSAPTSMSPRSASARARAKRRSRPK